MDRPGRISTGCMGEATMTDGTEIAVLHVLISNATLQVQTLAGMLNAGTESRDQARKTLKAIELAEESIRRAKSPLRRMIRRK